VHNYPRAEMACEPSIDGHIDLEIQSGDSINVNHALGSVGFLAHGTNYLETEHFLQLGYRSLWLVSLQRILDRETSRYRGLKTTIRRRQVPACTSPLGVQAKYGIVAEVAKPINKMTPRVSFIYRHQIHCWVEVKSKSRFRGVIVLAEHFIPDIRTDHGLRIRHRPTLDKPNMNVGEGSEDNSGTSCKEDRDVQKKRGAEGTDVDTSQETSKAAIPEAKKTSWVRRLIKGLFKGTRQQETTLPVSTLASDALRRSAIGWDHTNMNWYCPLWPELDCTLGHSSDKLRMKWRLDWGDEDVHDSETSGTSVA